MISVSFVSGGSNGPYATLSSVLVMSCVALVGGKHQFLLCWYKHCCIIVTVEGRKGPTDRKQRSDGRRQGGREGCMEEGQNAESEMERKDDEGKREERELVGWVGLLGQSVSDCCWEPGLLLEATCLAGDSRKRRERSG